MRTETKFNHCHWNLMLTRWEPLAAGQQPLPANLTALEYTQAETLGHPQHFTPSTVQNLQPKKGLACEGKAPPQPKVL